MNTKLRKFEQKIVATNWIFTFCTILGPNDFLHNQQSLGSHSEVITPPVFEPGTF